MRDPNTFRSATIEGYASLTSVNLGQEILFYVSTTEQSFFIEFWRLGWYNKKGGRRLLTTSDIPGSQQPMPRPQDKSNYGLVECHWSASYRLTIPTTWTSGVYLAKLTTRPFPGSATYQNYIVFVVRDDSRGATYLAQCSVNTYQAYNGWGGRSIYGYNCHPASINGQYPKVSFNRPYFAGHNGNTATQGTNSYATGSGHIFFNYPYDGSPAPGWEYNMIRWLEQNKYDVSYCTNIDVHRDTQLLLSHRAFLSVGHDEYWTREMRFNVELARDQGVDIFFFSGNSVYEQSRLESDSQGNPYRTLVCFKDGHLIDPIQTKINAGQGSSDDLNPYPNGTGEFKFIGWPETSLTASTLAAINEEDLIVAAPADWIFKNSASTAGQRLPGMAGYEIDGDPKLGLDPNADPKKRGDFAPGNRRILAKSDSGGLVQAYTVEGGTTVFSAGSVQWPWGLDDYVIPGCAAGWQRPSAAKPNSVVQKMTANLLARAARTTGAAFEAYHTDGNGGLVAFGPTLTGWGIKWRIVAGRFHPDGSRDALFYDPTTGQGQFYTLDNTGALLPIGIHKTNWRKTWKVIAGKFSDSAFTDLLFYDRALGEAQFYRTDGTGLMYPIGPTRTNWRRTWQIIPGKFHESDSNYTDLLFYDPAHGEAQFYSTDGGGGLHEIGELNCGWRKSWQTIVPGQFGGSSTLTDLLFYDSAHGEGQYCSTDGSGRIRELGGLYENWRKGWQIIPGRFRDGGTTTDLLFYDQSRGEAQCYSTHGADFMEEIGPLNAGWRKTWQIVAFPTEDEERTDLLFYDPFATAP